MPAGECASTQSALRPHVAAGLRQRHSTRKDRVAGIFATGVQQVTGVVNTSATLIWDLDNTSTTTFGALGSNTTGNVIKDLLINNTGTATMYVGTASVSSTTGLPVNPGGYVVLGSYLATVASSTTSDLWGITASGTTSALIGLASVVSVT